MSRPGAFALRLSVFPVLLGSLASAAWGQQSASFKLTELALNAGGHPRDDIVMTSAGYRVALDALGEGVVRSGLASVSYRIDGGFISPYTSPGEVRDLTFEDVATLRWSAERNAGTYNLYRDALIDLPELGYGACLETGLPDTSATDSNDPALGGGYFYLATSINRLGEEGTKGLQGDGTTERQGTICP